MWSLEQQMSKKSTCGILDTDCYFFKPRQPLHEHKFENFTKTLYNIYSNHGQLKNTQMRRDYHFKLFFSPALALKVLKKTIKEQVSVQGRIYWHLLLIYGPSLCSLSGLCQSFFLLYIS